MDYKGIEKRVCVHFEIPGATLNYKKNKIIFPSKTHNEEFCPVMDISRGGLRFLCQHPLKINTKVLLNISVPGERTSLALNGAVRWTSLNTEKSYKYQVGVQFNPYGEKKGQNYPGTLVKIISLEQKYTPESKVPKKETGK
ncbi:MAG: PilZ domain-containing protein [Candidatus Aminicenantes bacterium]|nr:PilZ domain-containing protein [Candidatus Aminicenantes bacterium]